MKHLSIVVLCAGCTVAGLPAAAADTLWTSTDGILTFGIPESDQFNQIAARSPMNAVWRSQDRRTLVGVLRYENNNVSGLDRATEAEELAREIHGKCAWLPNRDVNGFELWCIKGVSDSYNVFQTMFRHDQVYYKIVISTQEPLDPIFINRMLDSIAIKERGYVTQPGVAGHLPNKQLGAIGRFSPRDAAKLCALLSVALVSTFRILRGR